MSLCILDGSISGNHCEHSDITQGQNYHLRSIVKLISRELNYMVLSHTIFDLYVTSELVILFLDLILGLSSRHSMKLKKIIAVDVWSTGIH